jgi:hypothetical protein
MAVATERDGIDLVPKASTTRLINTTMLTGVRLPLRTAREARTLVCRCSIS